MDAVEDKIHRLSQLQLKILLLFTKSDNGIIFHPEKNVVYQKPLARNELGGLNKTKISFT